MVRILTNGSLLKRLVREAAGSNLNSRCFVDSRVLHWIFTNRFRAIT